MKRSIIITGGAGFIGSHVVRLFVNKYPEYKIINLDKLTYAGNLANLKDIEDKPNYKFVKMDICDFEAVYQLMQDEQVDGIIHLAAESHVDRSIKDPFTFAKTNVMGTLSLLQAAKLYWESQPEPYKVAKTQRHKDTESQNSATLRLCDSESIDCIFYHISTDEVYGALEMNHPEGIPAPHQTIASAHSSQLTAHGSLAYGDEFFYETTKYNPHSPYSASKASSDHFVRAYHDTYGMPTIVTNCSNNYGPYQFPEKLIPLFINNIRHRKPLPVYGKGENVRDWLYVEDHARAIDLIFHKGKIAETYNIGGFNEWKNIDLIKVIIKTVDKALGRVICQQPTANSQQPEFVYPDLD
ncbi:MAG: dTDP-glucose 4,6-dehydratase, partial [Bacteroidales bacterium]|nr:dTDP-glucose 4,6-dehydratase [Bacteroidales bacterium]